MSKGCWINWKPRNPYDSEPTLRNNCNSLIPCTHVVCSMTLTLDEGSVIFAVEEYLYQTGQIAPGDTVASVKRNRDNSFEVEIEETE